MTLTNLKRAVAIAVLSGALAAGAAHAQDPAPSAASTPDGTPEDAPRTGKDACEGAVFPLGYGLDAEGTLLGPAACSAP